MKRKGYNPSETDVPVILAIHNLVNEQGWSMIKRWEAYRGCDDPKLIRFCGRPKDVSPKAYLKSLLGYGIIRCYKHS
jgi:cytochrome c heme-lyase